MALRKKFATTIVVQSIGPAALFFSVWLIAQQLGVEAQGQFAAVKSLLELLTACLLFGLPQSFVFGINKLQIERNQLVRWIIGYGAAITLITGVLFWTVRMMQWSAFDLGGSGANSDIYLAFAVAGTVTYGLLRGVYLTISDGWRFSVLTISPALILSCITFVAIVTDHFNAVKIYALTGLLSALAAIFFLRAHTVLANYPSLPWRPLLENGGAVFMQGLLSAAQPYLTLAFLRYHTVNYTDVAYFSLAMYVYQAGVIPLTMVAPILYSRWTSASTSNKKAEELIQLLWGLIPVIALVAVAWIAAPWMLAIAFGESYERALPTIRIMIATVPLFYLVQVGAPVLMSMGLFRINVVLVASRLVVCVVSLITLLYVYPAERAQMAAWSWLVAESVTALFTCYAIKNAFKLHKNEENSLCS